MFVCFKWRHWIGFFHPRCLNCHNTDVRGDKLLITNTIILQFFKNGSGQWLCSCISSLYIFTKLFWNLVDGKFGVFESYVDELTFFFYMAIIYTYCGKSSICNTTFYKIYSRKCLSKVSKFSKIVPLKLPRSDMW